MARVGCPDRFLTSLRDSDFIPSHIHFISGLPRSSFTLLSALLKQNPRFHAGINGQVAGMVSTVVD